MDSLTLGLICDASAKLFPDKTLSSFTVFLSEKLNLEGQSEIAVSEISYPTSYQNVTEGKLLFFDTTFSFVRIILAGTRSTTDNVEAMNLLTEERHKHTETSM